MIDESVDDLADHLPKTQCDLVRDQQGIDADLQMVLDRWAELPDVVKAAIMAMLRVSS